MRRRLLRVAKWGAVTMLVLALLAGGAFVYLYQTTDIPEPNEAFQTQTTYVYYKNGEDELGKFAEQNRTSLAYADMPENVKNAVVAAENRTFWTDKGVDPKGILRAAFSNATSGTSQGASTITQQYVKILYLNQEHSYKRKIKEAILSLKIHNQYSKEQILEGYLNTIYFGRGAYGIEEASKAYFDIPAKKLNLQQAAMLASVLNNPYSLDPANGKEAKVELKERYDYVLDGMAEMGMITDEQAAKAQKKLPKFPKIAADNQLGGQKGHALTLVKNELRDLGFTPQEIESGGLRVTTTLSRTAMNAAEQGVKEARPEGKQFDNQLHVGAATVDTGTGALRGFYGGQDYLKSQINWAATGGMAGSTMKPVTAATALESGFELKDTFVGDSPYEYPNGETVQNEGEEAGIVNGMDYGRVDMIKSMEESINTAFIDMTEEMPDGPQQIHDTGMKMGIPPMKADEEHPGIPDTTGDFDPEDSRITLGKATVSPINMANTYATIANGGVHNDVYVVDKVEDANGEVLYQHKSNPTRAIREDISDDVSYTLQKTADEGTGSKNASSADLGRPVAGKTGTATKDAPDGDQFVSSAWYVGYTPQLATAVMYVRGDGNDRIDDWMPSYFGSEYPATTWASVMRRAMDVREVETFPPPAWVEGEAPSDGHDPLPPPPKKTKEPKPSKSAETQTSEPPASTSPAPSDTTTEPPEEPESSDTHQPSPSETDTDCDFIFCDPDDPTSSSSSSSPSASTSTDQPGGQDD